MAAQEETPEAECPVTTPEENEELATMYWEEVWWGDQGKIAEIVAPDEVHHWGIGGDTTGFEEFSERWDLFFTAFPDLEFTVDLVVAEGIWRQRTGRRPARTAASGRASPPPTAR